MAAGRWSPRFRGQIIPEGRLPGLADFRPESREVVCHRWAGTAPPPAAAGAKPAERWQPALCTASWPGWQGGHTPAGFFPDITQKRQQDRGCQRSKCCFFGGGSSRWGPPAWGRLLRSPGRTRARGRLQSGESRAWDGRWDAGCGAGVRCSPQPHPAASTAGRLASARCRARSQGLVLVALVGSGEECWDPTVLCLPPGGHIFQRGDRKLCGQ